MSEKKLRMQMVALGRSLFDRGYAAGGAGNLSVRIDANSFLATPSGSCLGRLDRERLSVVDDTGQLISGEPASKEVQFHLALYRNDPSCGSVVHLHSTWATILACRNDLNPEQVIRPFTPYYVMKIGRVQVIPYYQPGDIRIARDLEKWAGKRKAFLLQNHGPVVIGRTILEAADLMEEFEETARLAYLLEGKKVRYLSEEEVADLRRQ